MSAAIAVRPACAADLDEVWALCQTVKAQLTADGIPIWSEEYPIRDNFAEDLAAGGLLLAFADGRLAGALSCSTDHAGEYYFDLPAPQADAAARALLARCGTTPRGFGGAASADGPPGRAPPRCGCCPAGRRARPLPGQADHLFSRRLQRPRPCAVPPTGLHRLGQSRLQLWADAPVHPERLIRSDAARRFESAASPAGRGGFVFAATVLKFQASKARRKFR